MTPLKHKSLKKSDVLSEKKLEKYAQLFSKNFSQIFFDFGQKQLILHNFRKLRKISQNGKSGSVAPIKQGSLFCGLMYTYYHNPVFKPMFYFKTVKWTFLNK